MSERRRSVIHVGPRLAARGGIASALATIQSSDLADHYDLRIIETVGSGGLPARTVQSFLGVLRACLAALARDALVHVHVSIRGSFYRKSAVVLLARAAGRKVVLQIHSGEFDRFVLRGGRVRRGLARRVLASASAIAVLTETWGRTASALSGRDDQVVLPNAVRVPDAASHGIGGRTVCVLGRLSREKGTPVLLEAIRRLQSRGVGGAFVLAGDGDVEAVRREVASLPRPEDVSVPGWLDRAQIARLLERSAVFCLPSLDEGQPIALLEAMAYGLACVATSVGGIPETLAGGEAGILVPAGDPVSLASALERILEDGSLGERLGVAARRRVRDHFSVERLVERTERLYASLGFPPATSARGKVRMLGVVIDALTLDGTVHRIGEDLARGTPTLHGDVNAGKIVLLQRDARLREALGRCSLLSADGQGIVWASRVLGRPLPGRVAGIDLMLALLRLAEEKSHGVYFLGARPTVLERMVARLRGIHPALRIAGFHHGYFDERENASVVARIRASRAEMLFVGMPSPMKELWLSGNLEATGARFAMGVGGSFDVLAGARWRAPRWARAAGLEWLCRWVQEPRRLWKRYWVGNLQFLALVAREYLRERGASDHGPSAGAAGR